MLIGRQSNGVMGIGQNNSSVKSSASTTTISEPNIADRYLPPSKRIRGKQGTEIQESRDEKQTSPSRSTLVLFGLIRCLRRLILFEENNLFVLVKYFQIHSPNCRNASFQYSSRRCHQHDGCRHGDTSSSGNIGCSRARRSRFQDIFELKVEGADGYINQQDQEISDRGQRVNAPNLATSYIGDFANRMINSM